MATTKPKLEPGAKLLAKIRREHAWHIEMYAAGPGFVPLKTVNELNDHTFWRYRQQRAKHQHYAIDMSLACWKPLPPLPVTVTFTRYSPGAKDLDSDGAFAAMKFVRDAIAKAYGVDDGGTEIVWAWPVKQVTRCPGYGVRVSITPKAAEVQA